MSDNLNQFQYFPGHMKKALVNIENTLKIVHGAILVLDSRAPISSLPKGILKLLQNSKANDNLILLFSKSDLADNEKLNETISKHFDTNTTKVFKLNLNKNDSSTTLLNYLSTLKLKSDEKYIKLNFPLQPIDILVLGIPNVGKSTLINNLSKRKLAQVENKPGKTRTNTLFKITKRVQVIDTPGILEPNYEDKKIIKKLALLGCVKLDILPFDELLDYLVDILKGNKVNYEETLKRYNIDSFETSSELYDKVGNSKSVLTKGGIIDTDRVMRMILKDFQNGDLGKVFLD